MNINKDWIFLGINTIEVVQSQQNTIHRRAQSIGVDKRLEQRRKTTIRKMLRNNHELSSYLTPLNITRQFQPVKHSIKRKKENIIERAVKNLTNKHHFNLIKHHSYKRYCQNAAEMLPFNIQDQMLANRILKHKEQIQLSALECQKDMRNLINQLQSKFTHSNQVSPTKVAEKAVKFAWIFRNKQEISVDQKDLVLKEEKKQEDVYHLANQRAKSELNRCCKVLDDLLKTSDISLSRNASRCNLQNIFKMANMMFDDDELCMAQMGLDSQSNNQCNTENSDSSPFACQEDTLSQLREEYEIDFQGMKENFAAQMLQSTLNKMIKCIKVCNNQVVYRALLAWKGNLIERDNFSQQMQLKIQQQMLKTLNSLSKQNQRQQLQLINSKFYSWKSELLCKKAQKNYDQLVLQSNINHDQQIQELSQEANRLHERQNYLENIIYSHPSNQKRLQQTLEQQKLNPDKEKYIQQLERENQNLIDKIEAVEDNISGFIKEMSVLLEQLADDDGGERVRKVL